MIMMKKLSRKSFIEAATCTAAKGREESFKRWGKRRTHGIFLLSSRLQHRVLVHFLQVPRGFCQVYTFFCSLQCVEKVTAQMIPSSNPFKFWHGSLFVTSTVCMYFDVMISHGWPAKLPRRCSFFLFDRSAYFFSFSFFFLQCFWPCPFFFLQGPMLSLNSYNLNRFAKPTRCHPFNSFLQQPGVIICMVVILFATRGSTPLKKWSWWRN